MFEDKSVERYKLFVEIQQSSNPNTRTEWLALVAKNPERYNILLPYINRIPADLQNRDVLQSHALQTFKAVKPYNYFI